MENSGLQFEQKSTFNPSTSASWAGVKGGGWEQDLTITYMLSSFVKR